MSRLNRADTLVVLSFRMARPNVQFWKMVSNTQGRMAFHNDARRRALEVAGCRNRNALLAIGAVASYASASSR